MLACRKVAATLALAFVATLAACGDDDDDSPTGPGNGDPNVSVRFVNASGFAFDIATGGTVGTGNSNITSGGSSACARVNNANPSLAIRVAGSTTNLGGYSPNFQANGRYTVLVTGTAAAPVFTQFTDQFQAPGANRALVRLINVTNRGSFDVYVNPTATTTTPTATNLGRLGATSFIDVPAGSTTIRLTPAGNPTGTQLTATGALPAGIVRSLILLDPSAGSTNVGSFNADACTS